MGKYRGRIEIIADILKASSEPVKKTRIMFAANLSHRILEKYLKETAKVGLISSDNDFYEITEKGRVFLKRYTRFSSEYSILEKKVQNMRFERKVLEEMCELSDNICTEPILGRRRTRESSH